MSLYLSIFFLFGKISLVSFGGILGVLPEMERMIVNEMGWLTQERFFQAYVLGQFVPGPNMAMCPIIGFWVGGWGGFVAAFLGIYSAPIAMMSGVYFLYHKNRSLTWVRKFELAIRPVVFGLLSAAFLRIFWLQSGWLGQHLQISEWITHGCAVILLCVGIYFVRKKKSFPPMAMILAGGGIWCAFYYVLLLGKAV